MPAESTVGASCPNCGAFQPTVVPAARLRNGRAMVDSLHHCQSCGRMFVVQIAILATATTRRVMPAVGL